MKKCIVAAAIIGTGVVCYAAGMVDGVVKAIRAAKRVFNI